MDEALAGRAGVSDRDDAELARAATDDRAAFAAIYERHRTPEGLAVHWKITVHDFYAFDATTEQGHELHRPWVLEFDVAETP